jgi:DNA-binding SARP family transcriptional activator
MFGGVQVMREDESGTVVLTRAPESLLAYLLLGRRRKHARDVLAGMLWPDLSDERARAALNTALWRLRRALDPAAPEAYVQTSRNGDVGINATSDYWLDVEAFERVVGTALARSADVLEEAQASSLACGLRLYGADLLEGFCHDWALQERERLRLLYLDGMSRLMQHYRSRDLSRDALFWGRQILRIEPLREEVHREMMELYLKTGQRALAVRQYRRCQDIMQAELGVPPMDETRQLYARLIAPPERPNLRHPRPLNALLAARQNLDEAKSAFEEAQARLRQALEAFNEARSRSGDADLGRACRTDLPNVSVEHFPGRHDRGNRNSEVEIDP